MAKKTVKKTSGKQSARTTINGNKLFDGSEGNTFTSTNQPTPEQKSAGWARKRAREEFVKKIYGKLLNLAEKDNLTNREIIDLGKIAIEISGDKKNTQELEGSVGVQKIYVTPEMQQQAEDYTEKLLSDNG